VTVSDDGGGGGIFRWIFAGNLRYVALTIYSFSRQMMEFE
jgi:hypothetical protein